MESLRTTTSSQLLEALLDPGQTRVWSEFDGRYRPILFGFARRLGLDDESAAEVAQETLADFSTGYHAGKYDRTKGRLRSWILGIARHKVARVWQARGRRREWRGHSALDHLAEPELEGAWDIARRQVILDRALEELQTETKTAPETIDIFKKVALEQLPAERVASEGHTTTAEVYRIKYRLTRRLRSLVSRLEAIYSEDG